MSRNDRIGFGVRSSRLTFYSFVVSLKAGAGIVFPSVDYTWYVDSEQRAAGQAYAFEVSALDTISVATGTNMFHSTGW